MNTNIPSLSVFHKVDQYSKLTNLKIETIFFRKTAKTLQKEKKLKFI